MWQLDDVLIGGALVQPDVLYETFDAQPHPDSWLFWPGAKIDAYCSLHTRWGADARPWGEKKRKLGICVSFKKFVAVSRNFVSGRPPCTPGPPPWLTSRSWAGSDP